MLQMWNGKNISEIRLAAKRTTLGPTMDRPLLLWVAFGDRATAFGQHRIMGPPQPN